MLGQKGSGLVKGSPASLPETGFLPAGVLLENFHEVERYLERGVPLVVLIGAEGFSDQPAGDPGLFPGFFQCGLFAGVTRIDEPLRNSPVSRPRLSNETHLEGVVFPPDGNRGRLLRETSTLVGHVVFQRKCYMGDATTPCRC